MAKRIYFSGRSVTVDWLNASQYLGPSNPGVVFVSNPVNDFEYPLLKASSFDLTNIQNYFVATTTSQTVDGEKTFLVPPKVPNTTATTGTQAVNIDRLNTDLTNLNTLLSTTFNAGLTALTNNLVTNYATLGTTQSITGKKTFTQAPIVPEPIALDEAATLKTVRDATAGWIRPAAGGGVINLGPVQIVFGFYDIINSTPGQLSFSQSFLSAAPTMTPFLSLATVVSSTTEEATISTNFSTTDINWTVTPVGPAPLNGVINWIAIGYTATA